MHVYVCLAMNIECAGSMQLEFYQIPYIPKGICHSCEL